MPISYRIHTIGHDGYFFGTPKVAECADDKDAAEKATQLAGGLEVEIWDHKRFVARLPGSPLKV
jgi:hypothetical protein